MFNVALLWLINSLLVACAKDTIYVCKANDPKTLGIYSKDPEKKEDDVSVYTNPRGLSFYRHNKFWYLGDLDPWPPVTFYRCVSADHCNYDTDFPPDSTGAWSSKNGHGGDELPNIQYEPCDTENNSEISSTTESITATSTDEL